MSVGLQPRFELLELHGVDDANQVTSGKAHDAAALQGTGRAAHRLERQSQVAGDVRSAHGQFDVMRPLMLVLELSDEHRQPAHGVATADGDRLPLRLAQFVCQLAEELELQIAVALERLDEDVWTSN